MAELLTPAEVADRWQVHPRTVKRLAEQGKLRGLRVGDLWRFKLVDVEAYELGHTSEPEPNRSPAPTSFVTPSGIGVTYEPVVKGPVPWRLEVVDAVSPAGTGDTRKKAPSVRR